MNVREVLHLVGALLVWTAAAMVPSATMAVGEGLFLAWLGAVLCTGVAGVALWCNEVILSEGAKRPSQRIDEMGLPEGRTRKTLHRLLDSAFGSTRNDTGAGSVSRKPQDSGLKPEPEARSPRWPRV